MADETSKTPDVEMKRGLFEASKAPAKLCDIRSFQNLHRPTIHGMAEWLLQYESAHRRQELYLQQIRDLRLQFRNGNDRPIRAKGGNCESFKTRQRVKEFWLPPAVSQSTDGRFPNQICVLHPRPRRRKINNRPTNGDVPVTSPGADFLMAPSSYKSGTSQSYNGQSLRGEAKVKLPPIIGELDRHETDYEPIEHIAQRNRLNLNKYLKSKQSATTWAKASGRDTMDVSDVVIQATKVP